jgi:hypothetical protein
MFGSWRHIWDQDPKARELAQQADSLAEERNKGRQEPPSGDLLAHFSRELHLFKSLYENVPAPDSGGPFQFYRAYAASVISLLPLIEAARWPRWLYLEQALAISSHSGDLLVAALALRNQIEELRTLRELNTYESALPKLVDLQAPFAVTPADCQRMRNHASILWARVLPMMIVPTADQMICKRELPTPIAPEPQALTEAFAALNDYVHPNYGSHVYTIWPEQAIAGEVLLKAFIAIYRAFLGQDWARLALAPAKMVSACVARTNADEVALFVEATLPRLDRALREKHGYQENWTPVPISIFADTLKRNQKSDEDMIQLLTASDFVEELRECREQIEKHLGRLCDILEPSAAPHKTEDILTFPKRATGYGLPASFLYWNQLSAIRGYATRLDQLVDQLGEEGAFPDQPPYDNWVEFLKVSVEFAVTVSIYKMEAMRVAAMRMLNEENFLGAVLCARSLIEHYAVARYLAERFHEAWEKVEEAARSNRDLRQPLAALESDVGRFLAGTKRTAELSTRWRERWSRAGMARHINLEAAIKKCFSEEDYRFFLYAWFSRIIHGDALTGCDLLPTGSNRIVEKQYAKVIGVLAGFENGERTLDIVAPVAIATGRIARPGGIAAAGDMTQLRTAIHSGAVPEVLRPGRDVFGAGTEQDPYRFRKDLVYHDALHSYLGQNGIEWELIEFWPHDCKLGDCVITKDARRLYFVSAQTLPPASFPTTPASF